MKILNFGSLNIDNVYTVEEFVRPGESVTAKSHTVFAGGKGLNPVSYTHLTLPTILLV